MTFKNINVAYDELAEFRPIFVFQVQPHIATCGSKINDVRVLNVAVTEKCLSLRRTSLTLILQLMNT